MYQLFRLFGGEKFVEWPNNCKWILKILGKPDLPTTCQCFLLFGTLELTVYNSSYKS